MDEKVKTFDHALAQLHRLGLRYSTIAMILGEEEKNIRAAAEKQLEVPIMLAAKSHLLAGTLSRGILEYYSLIKENS